MENKTKKSKKMRTKAISTILCICGVFGIAYYCSQNLLINPSNSIETGIYRNALINDFSKGNYVSYKPSSKFQKYIEANYNLKKKAKEVTVLKKIVAAEGDVIEIKDYNIYINGENMGKIVKLKGLTENLADSRKVLLKDEFFLMGETPDSFDSRYFGTVKRKEIISEVKLVASGKSLERALGWINKFNGKEKKA